MQYSKDFEDYELLDMADGEKLERWGKYLLIRPDPQIIWSKKEKPELWKDASARYLRSKEGGGYWDIIKNMEKEWKVKYKKLVFNIKPMGFKHTGLFPEQSVNWDDMIEKIEIAKKSGREDIKVLNLFAYTGGATVACSFAGAEVCHVDSSKGMTLAAKENIESTGLGANKVRYIVDDVVKFVQREIRRGSKYDAVIMDPPSYGRGASGEVWSIEKDLYNLICLCCQILSDDPIFFNINTYTGGLSGTVISNVLKMAIDENSTQISGKGQIVTNEIGIKVSGSELMLPCGITTKWEKIYK